MAGITKITVDQAVYEYSCYVWGLIANDSPKKIVGQLSAGDGIVSKTGAKTGEDLLLLMRQTNTFLPRVRLKEDYGYRSGNTEWRRSLQNKKRSLKAKVMYLTDAVNQIVSKPYNDEITRLRESVKAELELQKAGVSLTAEQQKKVNEVDATIADKKKQIRSLPRCTNQILTTLLHEYVDHLNSEDARTIKDLEYQIRYQDGLIRAANDKLEKEEFKNDSDKRLEQEHTITNAKAKIEDLRQKCFKIRQKYYEKFHVEMTPLVIAKELTEYAGTVWEAFDINTNMIEEYLKVSSPTRVTKSEDEKKSKRRQPSLAERGENFLLFPHSVIDAQFDDRFKADLANDLKVTHEWDEWAKTSEAKEFTQDYKNKYEGLRAQLKTLPKKKANEKKPDNAGSKPVTGDAYATPQSTHGADTAALKDQNYKEFMSYMKYLSLRLEYGKDFDEPKNQEYIREFAYRGDFNYVFNVLKVHERECKKFSHAMQYVRDVHLRNKTEWQVETE